MINKESTLDLRTTEDRREIFPLAFVGERVKFMKDKGSRLRLPVGIFLVAATLAAGTIGCGAEKQTVETETKKVTNVEVGSSRQGSILQETNLTGHVQALKKAEIYPRVAGRVAAVLVREGDKVRQGQVLVHLEDSTQRSNFESAKAALAQAEAALVQAKASHFSAETAVEQAHENLGITDVSAAMEVQKARQGVIQAQASLASAQATYDDALYNMHRQQDLFAKDAVSSYDREQAELRERTSFQQLTSAKSALQAAKETLRIAEANQRQVAIRTGDVKVSQATARQALASIQQAEATLQAAQAAYHAAAKDLEDMSIKSPIDGTITSRNVEIGNALVASGETPILSVVDNSTLEMVAPIDEKFAPYVKTGADLKVNTSMAEGVPAQILEVVPASDPSSHTIKVRLRIPNEKGLLVDGTYAEARLPIQRLEGIIVPRTAVNMAVGEVYVVAYDGDPQGGTAKKYPVTMTYGNASEALVTGIDPGLTVVTSGGIDLLDGQALRVAQKDGKK